MDCLCIITVYHCSLIWFKLTNDCCRKSSTSRGRRLLHAQVCHDWLCHWWLSVCIIVKLRTICCCCLTTATDPFKSMKDIRGQQYHVLGSNRINLAFRCTDVIIYCKSPIYGLPATQILQSENHALLEHCRAVSSKIPCHSKLSCCVDLCYMIGLTKMSRSFCPICALLLAVQKHTWSSLR